jgi:hypothetical protein
MKVLLFADCLLHAGAETLEGGSVLLNVRDAVKIAVPVQYCALGVSFMTVHVSWILST